MSKLAPLEKNNLPRPLPLKKLIGPSFIILGVGLGSGELILWPYLSSNFGLGIIWAAVLGITFQFFINMEIERYTLITGESIFVGLRRKFGFLTPIWFILSTFLPWMWPGIIAASAVVFSAALGIEYSGIIGIILLVLIGVLYSLGSVVYKTQEKTQMLIILLGVPFIFILTIFLSEPTDWQALTSGLVGSGDGYRLLPEGLPYAIFLGALAYAGAGGNLNLAQSLYIKEKGYGMGKFSGRLTSVFRGKEEDIKLTGTTFDTTPQNMAYYKTWWKRINIEHGLVFWLTGTLTMLMLSVLAYTTVYGHTNVDSSINFVIEEGIAIAHATTPFIGKFFLIMVGIMLFGTQFSVYGSNSRIMSENLVLANQDKFKVKNMSKYFYIFLWLQIAAGIVVFSIGFTEPLALVVTGAVLNAISMFIYSVLVLVLNKTKLERPLRPSLVRTIGVGTAIAFYGFFSLFVIINFITK